MCLADGKWPFSASSLLTKYGSIYFCLLFLYKTFFSTWKIAFSSSPLLVPIILLSFCAATRPVPCFLSDNMLGSSILWCSPSPKTLLFSFSQEVKTPCAAAQYLKRKPVYKFTPIVLAVNWKNEAETCVTWKKNMSAIQYITLFLLSQKYFVSLV